MELDAATTNNSDNNETGQSQLHENAPAAASVAATLPSDKAEMSADAVLLQADTADTTSTPVDGSVDEQQQQQQQQTLAPESYLDHDPFSSERFKLEIKNLPVSFGFAQIRKLLSQLKLKFVKLKAPGNSSYAFVTFVNEEARAHACRILNGHTYKGRQLEAIYSKPAEDPLTGAKRKSACDEAADRLSAKIQKNQEQRAENDSSSNSKQQLSVEERVQNSTTPLWTLGYEQQVAQKREHIRGLLRKCAHKIDTVNKILFFWLQKQKSANDGMCCPLDEFVKSPVIDNYRNKCEFTIGYDAAETKSVIGFRLGDYKSGSNEVVEPYCCRHIPTEMKSLTKRFQAYVDQSAYKAFNVRTRAGNWRQLTLRGNERRELLAIVVFDKQDLEEEQIAREKQLLTEFFAVREETTAETNDYTLKGLLFNLNTNRNGISKMDNLDILLGENCLFESLMGIQFRVSPLAFFQANTKGAEVLYRKIGDICSIDSNTVVLDICCGTGTIGLTLAARCKLVVGVEIVPEAIEDAKANSRLNNVTNVEFHCGKAEDLLPNLLKRFTNERVVAILDPPRAGLHSKVIQSLRRLENLQNLIYVSCNPDLAMQNFVDLGRESSKNYAFSAFVPTRAIAVDMFPHTSHCELIIYFKRYSKELISSDRDDSEAQAVTTLTPQTATTADQ